MGLSEQELFDEGEAHATQDEPGLAELEDAGESDAAQAVDTAEDLDSNRETDAKALAEKVNEALLHPDLEKIGEAAREKAADFLPEKTVEELLRYYRQVIGEH